MTFWSRPDQFSVKDLLALAFSGQFFYLAFRSIADAGAFHVFESYVPVVAAIVAGYFGQEVVTTYANSKKDKPTI